MTYRVIWDRQATEELQRIYDATLDKQGLVNTVTRIGLELSARPGEAGESRDGETRVMFKFPLVVWFEIHERMKEAVVIRVGRMRP